MQAFGRVYIWHKYVSGFVLELGLWLGLDALPWIGGVVVVVVILYWLKLACNQI